MCTYIHKRGLAAPEDLERGGGHDMYDTARRVGLVKKRVREMTRRKRRRGIYGLSAVCMLLFAAMIEAAGLVIGQGETAAQGIFGAMLLRRDAGGYVLLGTVSFAAAVVLTVLCIRLRDREKMRKDRADRSAPQEQEGREA